MTSNQLKILSKLLQRNMNTHDTTVKEAANASQKFATHSMWTHHNKFKCRLYGAKKL